MFKSYLKIAVRNILKHKGYAAINIFGLALGLSCVILIGLYIDHERGYDTFHADGDRMFRILRVSSDEQGTRYVSPTSAPFGPALANDFPSAFEAVTRVSPNDGLVTFGEKSFTEKRFYLTDDNFFEFFTYPLAQGDPATVLKDPHSVVITEAMAQKYFGRENPIGKVLRYDDNIDFKVTGIAGEIPGNSHLNFDFVANLTVYKDRTWYTKWWSNFLFTYVKLKPNVDAAGIISQFPAFMDKYFGADFKQSGRRTGLTLEPVPAIYLNRDTAYDLVPHGDQQTLYIFAGVSILILLIACLNFMNLSTAKSSGRAKEVGLRKVVGAQRRNLVGQFMGESVVLAFMALGLSLVMVEMILPALNSFLGKELSWTEHFITYGPVFLLGTLIVGAAAGSYPALFLSRFQPIHVLKQFVPFGSRKGATWKILVVLQFSISVFLIISTMMMVRQMKYVSEKNLGFDKEHLLMIRLNNGDIQKNIDSFKRQLLADPSALQVSNMSGEPGGFHDKQNFEIVGRTGENVLMRTVFTDFDYLKTFGLKVVHGRDFSEQFGTDDKAIILNEAAVRSLGWNPEEALGKTMRIPLLSDPSPRTVIGIVKDYHFSSLKEEIQPLAISIHPDRRVCAIRLKSSQLQESVSRIEKIWAGLAPKYPIEYNFLDDSFEKLYRNETKQQYLLSVFSVMAIVIACLGLLGLAAFSAEKRTKEIGIRKVLGASAVQLVGSFTKEFVVLVIAANLLAIPVAYFAVQSWLENFAYHIDVTAGVFLVSGLAVLVIAVATVSFQAVKAATDNPVKALKYE